MRQFVDTRGTEYFYVARLRPLGVILVVLTTGILLAVMLILLLGAFLIWIPVVVLLVTAAIIAGLLRGYFERTFSGCSRCPLWVSSGHSRRTYL
jgi:hypothetical protein